jgi:hypothetical protein
MKHLFILVATFLLASTAYAQKTTWAAMDTFHELSNKILHPAIAGNLAGVKTYHTELLKDAINWQLSAAPKGNGTPQIKTDIDNLVKQCKALGDAANANKPDDELIALADAVHQSFHKLLSEIK